MSPKTAISCSEPFSVGEAGEALALVPLSIPHATTVPCYGCHNGLLKTLPAAPLGCNGADGSAAHRRLFHLGLYLWKTGI